MKLAVVTTYYNEVEIIGDVVEGLRANNTPFDFYLADDCSSKPPSAVLEKYGREPWFHYLRNEKNSGAVFGLNRAIRAAIEAGADLIAINDADDIPYRNRFPDQLAAFRADPELAIVGGAADMVDYDSGAVLWQAHHATSHNEIRRNNRVNSTFVHSTVIFRRQVFEKAGFYNPSAYAYDYDMISRGLAAGFKAGNVASVVLKYNIRANSMSVSKRRTQIASRMRVQLDHFDAGNFWSYYGLARSIAAYIAPNNAATNAKTIAHRISAPGRN